MTYTKHISGVNMVQAVVSISERANRVLNVVKARYGLRTKSEAIDRMAADYEEEVLEPAFKPEFTQEILERSKSKDFIKVRKVSDLFR